MLISFRLYLLHLLQSPASPLQVFLSLHFFLQISFYTPWFSPHFSPLRFTREEECQWLGGVRKNGRAVPINRSVLSTPALVEQNQIKRRKKTLCMCVCVQEMGGQLGVYPANTSETHDSLAYYYKVSPPFSWTLAHLGSAEQGQKKMRGGERGQQAAKGLTHSGGINTPTPTTTHSLTHAHANIWQQTEWVMWHFGRGQGYWEL